MSSRADGSYPAVDCATLEPPVRRALGRDGAVVESWLCAALAGGFASEAGGPFRLTGTARDRGLALPWSMVLKVIAPPRGAPTTAHDPGHFLYWRREPNAYQSGLLDDLPVGLAAPRFFGVEERPDGACWLWLEDMRGGDAPPWTLERYALAARHLGRFNGAYLAGLPLPAHHWLARRYLHGYLAVSTHEAAAVEALRRHASWRSPAVRRAFSVPVVSRLLALSSELSWLANLSERLPRTLCHFDAHRRNLFARRREDGEDETVAIDWAAVGLGPVGADAGYLMAATAVFDGPAGGDVRVFGDAVFGGYLDGLHDAGWRGDPAFARLGFCAVAVARWAVNVAGLVLENTATDGPGAEVERWLGRPFGPALRQWIDLTLVLLDLADEARRLSETVGLSS